MSKIGPRELALRAMGEERFKKALEIAKEEKRAAPKGGPSDGRNKSVAPRGTMGRVKAVRPPVSANKPPRSRAPS